MRKSAKKFKTTQVSYEPEADILSWMVSDQPIDYAEEAGNLVVHFSKNHKPVLVEMLEASKFAPKIGQRISRGLKFSTPAFVR